MDLYALLGVEPDSTDAQIRRAYRALLRRYHPDLRAGDDAAAPGAHDLSAILAAYAVLGDPVRRAGYDRQRRRAWRARHVIPVRHVERPDADRPPIQAGPVHWTPCD